MDQIKALLAKVEGLLQGEPLRAIGYGSAVIVYFVASISGRFGDLSFADSLTLTVTSGSTVIGIVEAARRYVFSPASVAAIVATVGTSAVDQTNLNPADSVVTDVDA